jgi:hypothetical protein
VNASTGRGARHASSLDDIRREAIRGDERLLKMLTEDQQVRVKAKLKQNRCSIM